jgi:hypothetical protein
VDALSWKCFSTECSAVAGPAVGVSSGSHADSVIRLPAFGAKGSWPCAPVDPDAHGYFRIERRVLLLRWLNRTEVLVQLLLVCLLECPTIHNVMDVVES